MMGTFTTLLPNGSNAPFSPYLVPRTSYLGPRTSYLVPRTSYLVPRTSYLVPRTSYLVPRTSYLVPRTSYLVPRTSYLVPRTSYLVPRTSYLVPRTSPSQVLSPESRVQILTPTSSPFHPEPRPVIIFSGRRSPLRLGVHDSQVHLHNGRRG